MEESGRNETEKFKKVPTSDMEGLMLREVLGMLALDSGIVTWSKRIVLLWETLEDTGSERYKVIIDGTNRRWLVSSVELVDDKEHLVISMFQAGYSKVIVWNISENSAPHKTCVSNPHNDNIIPITSSLMILCRDTECNIFCLNKYNRKYLFYDTVDFNNFDIIKVLKDNRNHIVTLKKIENVISIWKITRSECRRVSSYRSKHLAGCISMDCISKSVLILTCFDNKLLLKLSSNNHIYSENIVPNFYFSQILTNFSNTVILFMRMNSDFNEVYHLVNMNTGTSQEIVSAPYGVEESKCQCVYLRSIHTILVLTYDTFNLYKHTLPDSMVIDIQYGEIRKNARLISQALRTGSSPFQYLPVEICIKIISMTSEHIFGMKARRLAEQFFCQPLPST